MTKDAHGSSASTQRPSWRRGSQLSTGRELSHLFFNTRVTIRKESGLIQASTTLLAVCLARWRYLKYVGVFPLLVYCCILSDLED